jgi:uncharacterized membrane protein YfcA
VILALAALTAFIAAAIQRITGIGFVLVFLGPIVLLYGAYEGPTLAIMMALVAAAAAIPLVWRDIEWKRSLWLIVPGLLFAPLGSLIVHHLPSGWLMVVTAALAFFALVAAYIPALAQHLQGRRGAVIAGSAAGLMHVTAGLSGPPVASYAVGDKWDQRRFAASIQLIFVVFSAVSIALRGWPTESAATLWTLVGATALGIVAGSLLNKFVPKNVARTLMLILAWAGAIVLLVRGLIAIF